MFVNVNLSFFSGTDSEIKVQFNFSEMRADSTTDDDCDDDEEHVRCACKRGDCVARKRWGSLCAEPGRTRCWHYSRNCH